VIMIEKLIEINWGQAKSLWHTNS